MIARHTSSKKRRGFEARLLQGPAARTRSRATSLNSGDLRSVCESAKAGYAFRSVLARCRRETGPSSINALSKAVIAPSKHVSTKRLRFQQEHNRSRRPAMGAATEDGETAPPPFELDPQPQPSCDHAAAPIECAS